MNIQISVIIWTVICFVLLMLILHNLLFKPVLKVMDERKERLEKARKKNADIDAMLCEHEKKLLEQKEEYFEAHKREVAEKLADIQAESKNAVVEARQKRLSDVDAYRTSMQAERERIVTEVSANTKSIAEAFARQIISR